MLGMRAAAKRVLLGRPRSSRELAHQLLPRWMALPVFASDALSSVAYATQEMMLVLALAGSAALGLVRPLAAVVSLLMVIVVVSYRQTIRAYPRGGGAYIVARDNLGDTAGLVAAGALLVDYTLTVAVSTAAGVAAIIAAAPELEGLRVPLAILIVVGVTLANLRGVREAGLLFALPTYFFIAMMGVLVLAGLARCALEGCPDAPVAGPGVATAQALGVLLVLRAFATGATALTGVEAISNGVPAFRYPQSRNAASTLAIMAAIAVALFLGISFLAVGTGATPSEGTHLTVVAQIAQAVLGDGIGFYAVQVATTLILVLAANTSFADFPRLGSILAQDRWLPHQLVARGDRLVFSNGILTLAAGAIALLIAFGANVTELVQLYVLGVFISFTLSQTGMVRHWNRVREPGWRRSLVLNLIGAVVTAVVLVVVAITKFLDGAWMVLTAIPVLVVAMRGINGHYRRVSAALRAHVADRVLVEGPRRADHHVILLIDRVDEAAARALSYALSTQPTSLITMALPIEGEDVPARWRQLAPDVPLQLLPPAASRGIVDAVAEAAHRHAQRHAGAGEMVDGVAHPEGFTNVVIAETLSRSWFDQMTEHRLALRIKQRLLADGSLVITDFTSPVGGPGPYTVEEPVRHHVVVLVSAVNSATLRALHFARSLSATDVTALSVNLDVEVSNRVLGEWGDWGIDVPLEVVDSPFRSLTRTIRSYVRDFLPDGRSTIVTCVLPEFLLPRAYQQPLHNQSALLVKAALLFERGVVTTSVPYHLAVPLSAAAAQDAERRPTDRAATPR